MSMWLLSKFRCGLCGSFRTTNGLDAERQRSGLAASSAARFETLKVCLLQAHVVIHTDRTNPYMLHTDAADVGVRAPLSQLETDGLSRLLAY